MKKFLVVLITASSVIFNASVCRSQEDFTEMARVEADYILMCQFMDYQNPAYGAINNFFGQPTWVVPRENANAILGLIMASEILSDPSYYERAQTAADYLVKVQDKDGAWYNQYSYINPGNPNNPQDTESVSKSPTQTAQVMIALYKLGFKLSRYPAMKKAAKYLMACQENGGDGYLLGGGKDSKGGFRSYRWASDNAFSYQALKSAEVWANNIGEHRFAIFCSQAASRILRGINTRLYIKNPYDPDFGVWYRVVDEKNQPVDIWRHDWINYAPAMIDVPAAGVGQKAVGEWIHDRLQKPDGSCVWDDVDFKTRGSPGFSFQAVLCWRDLGQTQYYTPALDWALDSGLWQTRVDDNGTVGGWIDWTDPARNEKAFWWENFIDTSFYAIAAFNGGFDYSVVPRFLRVSYENPEKSKDKLPFYLKFNFDNILPEE